MTNRRIAGAVAAAFIAVSRSRATPARFLGVLVLSPVLLFAASAGAPDSYAASLNWPPRPHASSDWPQANYDFANTRYATESTLSSENVDQLGVAWAFDVHGASAFGALAGVTPVVVSDIAYIQDLESNVYAIHLPTGQIKWERDFNAENVGPNGPAVADGKIFVTSDMQTVTALDSYTGVVLWSTQIAPPETQGITQQLTAYNGTVYVSTVPGPNLENFYIGGGMGVIYALDAETGAVKWSFNTVKDGELWGNPEVNSGGGAWYPPAIDTATGVTYWGTGNPAPIPGTEEFPNGSSRPGDNLYTDSMLALDSEGNLLWYQQVKPHDLTDSDFQASPILSTATIDGVERNIVIGAGKLGYVVAFDAQTGEQLWKTAVGKHQNDDLEAFPEGQETIVYPGSYGGVETPMAVADGVVYVPVVNSPSSFTPSTWDVSMTGLPGPDTGELVAIDVNTGQILWKVELGAPDFGSAVVAGDLVFTATATGQVLAFERQSGVQVWSWQAPAGINANLAVAGDTLLVPVGQGDMPLLVALKIGATGMLPSTGGDSD